MQLNASPLSQRTYIHHIFFFVARKSLNHNSNSEMHLEFGKYFTWLRNALGIWKIFQYITWFWFPSSAKHSKFTKYFEVYHFILISTSAKRPEGRKKITTTTAASAQFVRILDFPFVVNTHVQLPLVDKSLMDNNWYLNIRLLGLLCLWTCVIFMDVWTTIVSKAWGSWHSFGQLTCKLIFLINDIVLHCFFKVVFWNCISSNLKLNIFFLIYD